MKARSSPAAPPVPAHPGVIAAAGVLAALTVGVQVSYPLLDGRLLTAATIAAVLLFTSASLTHAAAVHGLRAVPLLLLGAGGVGLLAEAVGVRTGMPFGQYTYADTLGAKVAGVPLVVPLAWTMMAYPSLVLARRVTATVRSGPARRALVAAAGGLTLAGWDLFLDPQMVDAGHWTWAFPSPHLPGVPQIPLTNYAGWLLVGVIMIAVIDLLLPRVGRDDAPAHRPGCPPARLEATPAALLVWTWLGSALANLAFFDRAWVALYGGAAMALTVVPYLMLLRRDLRTDPPLGPDRRPRRPVDRMGAVR